jgi:hypothetical protein
MDASKPSLFVPRTMLLSISPAVALITMRQQYEKREIQWQEFVSF